VLPFAAAAATSYKRSVGGVLLTTRGRDIESHLIFLITSERERDRG